MADGEGGKKKLIKLIVMALVGLALVGGGIVAVMMFMGGSEEELQQVPAKGESALTEGICENDSLAYLPLGTFVVNLADGRRYLKTNVELTLCDEKVEKVNEFLVKHMPEVKDLIVSELQTLNSEQLRDVKEREMMKQRLLRKIESLLPSRDFDWEDPKPIKRVLITEFYLQ